MLQFPLCLSFKYFRFKFPTISNFWYFILLLGNPLYFIVLFYKFMSQLYWNPKIWRRKNCHIEPIPTPHKKCILTLWIREETRISGNVSSGYTLSYYNWCFCCMKKWGGVNTGWFTVAHGYINTKELLTDNVFQWSSLVTPAAFLPLPNWQHCGLVVNHMPIRYHSQSNSCGNAASVTVNIFVNYL